MRTVLIVLATLVLAGIPVSGAQAGITDVGKAITVEFAILPSEVSVPPSFQIAGMTFFAHGSPDSSYPRIVDWGPPHERSYGFPDEGVTVVLPLEAWGVEIRICPFAGDVLVEAYSSTGTLVTQDRTQFHNTCDDLLLSGDSDLISIVRFTGGQNEASIARLSAILSSAPWVNAGEDQFVASGKLARLSGTAWDPYTGITTGTLSLACPAMVGYTCPNPFASFAWEQIGGTEVSLEDLSDSSLVGGTSDSFYAEFVAPEVSVIETLTFRLTVTNHDDEMGSDDVRIIVHDQAIVID